MIKALPKIFENSDYSDNTRRSNLLNIILAGISVVLVITALLTVLTSSMTRTLFVAVAGVSILVITTFAINRFFSVSIASWVFLIALPIIISLSDTPQEVTDGRTLFLFTIPIFLASVLQRPYSTFIMALIVAVVLNVVSLQADLGIVFLMPLSLFVVSLVSWVSARSLEQALTDVRQINEELDQRVERRTLALQMTNAQLQDEIIDRTRMQEELMVARDQALSANIFKAELLARVSHELRTPLGAMLGYLEMLRAEIFGPIVEEQKPTISNLIGLNHDLTTLVNELLDQSKLDADQVKLNNTLYAPIDMIVNTQERLGILARNKEIDLDYTVEKTLPSKVCGDEDRVYQILVNLVGNAIKFTDKGGVYIHAFDVDANTWGFSVRDTGPGIPQNEVDKIFNAFHQVEHAYTRKKGGFGLGLSIVYKLVQVMNGTISVDSQVGVGSKFIIHLPVN